MREIEPRSTALTVEQNLRGDSWAIAFSFFLNKETIFLLDLTFQRLDIASHKKVWSSTGGQATTAVVQTRQ